MRDQATKNGIFSAKAKAGSVLLFHSNIIHGSTINMSPFDRTVLMITYNSVNNKLEDKANPRPDFLASREFKPLQPITHSLNFIIKKL